MGVLGALPKGRIWVRSTCRWARRQRGEVSAEVHLAQRRHDEQKKRRDDRFQSESRHTMAPSASVCMYTYVTARHWVISEEQTKDENPTKGEKDDGDAEGYKQGERQ